MKNNILLFATVISVSLMFNKVYSQSSGWLWAKSAGGTSFDYAYSVATDATGNAYIVGSYQSPSISFDSTTLTSSGGSDIFLAKYSTSGNLEWAIGAGGTDEEEAHSVAVDAMGNVYVAGWFLSSTITFGSTTLTCSGGSDVFIVKYSSTGSVVWAKSAGSASSDNAKTIAVDATGNVYLAGYFNSTITFDAQTLTSAGSNDIFIVKYNSDGNVIWTKSAGGLGIDEPNAVVIDAAGNAYLAGFFQSTTIDFDLSTLTNSDNTGNKTDLFLTKYDPNGDVLWAKRAGAMSDDEATAIAIDDAGGVYIVGYFSSTSITFGSINLTNANSMGDTADIFIAKYDDLGIAQWAFKSGGKYEDKAFGISVTPSGIVNVAGWYSSSTISFGTYSIPLYGEYDLFVAKYDTQGNTYWAKKAGGSQKDCATSIADDASGNVFVAGYYGSSSITFGATNLAFSGDSGTFEIYLTKLVANAGINELDNSYDLTIYPNPSRDVISVIFPVKSTIEILNLNGQIVKSVYINDEKTMIDVADLRSGIYFVKIKTNKGIVVDKLIKE